MSTVPPPPPPPPEPPPGQVGGPGGSGYPVQLDLAAPYEIARWRPLVHWLLVIPHFIVLWLFSFVVYICVIIAFFTVLFTKQVPQGVFDLLALYFRYTWRANSYAQFMREPYPPFDFTPSAYDPGIDPARLSVEYPQELNRWLPLVKWLLAIPHYIVLLLLGIVVFFVYIFAFFAVIITGRWPEGARAFAVGTARWSMRVQAYVYLLTDEYPPFSLD